MSKNSSALTGGPLSKKSQLKNFNIKTNINDPEFEKLTAAEKLNDSRYRSLIYRTYPNEPTCGCKSAITEQSTTTRDIDNHKSNEDFLVCPGGCKKSCCLRAMRSRVAKNQDNGNYDKVLRIMSTYCVGNQPSNKVYNGTYCPDEGMRGGGGVKEENCEYENLELTERLKYAENVRLRGGGFGYSSRYDVEDPHEIKTYFLSSRFHNQSNNQFNPMPGSVSPDKKEALQASRSHEEICTKRRCMHVKCLIRKFEEAQEFVNSLGKVPGLPGLGLMDPSESPYFRAFREPEKLEEMSRTFFTQLPLVNPQCGGPYNPAIKSTSPWIKATPFTIAVPGRGGIVQEAIIPGAYGKDNAGELSGGDETGPCGESMCKARRKKINRRRSSVAVVNSGIELNLNKEKKSKNNKRTKQHKLRRRRRHMISSSQGNFRSRNEPKKIRYVYLGGETYPGFIYGHKNCNDRLKRVPANMGWFWSQYQVTGRMKPRVGWKPGAISRQIREIIKDAKDGLIEKRSKASLASSIEMRGKKLKSKSAMSLRKGHSKKFEEEEELEPPPTLHIQRREGIYYVTMYPIKKEKMDVPKLDEPMKPLQFKINPKKDNNSDATSSTASDMEIEFSPPAAGNRYRRKPNVIHIETQVKQQEILDAFKPAVDKKKEKKGKKKKKEKNEDSSPKLK